MRIFFLNNKNKSVVEYIIVLAIVAIIIAFMFPKVHDGLNKELNNSVITVMNGDNVQNKQNQKLQVQNPTENIKKPVEQTNNQPQATTSKSNTNEPIFSKSDIKTLKSIFGILLSLAGTIFVFYVSYMAFPHIKQWYQDYKKREAERPKDVYDLIKFIYYKNLNKVFTLRKKKLHYAYFTYSKWSFLIEVEVVQHLLHCKIKDTQNNDTVLYFVYDQQLKTFNTKNISQLYIHNQEKELKIFDAFVHRICEFKWTKGINFNVTEDVNIEKDNEELLSTIPTILNDELKEEISCIEKELEAKKIDTVLSDEFYRVVNRLGELDHHLQNADIETQHLVEYTLRNDLSHLLGFYSELDNKTQEELKGKVSLGLEKIEQKINAIQEKLENEKAAEVEKVLLVIENRYNEDKKDVNLKKA